MSTYRVRKRENPFVQIDKAALQDTRLSWKAKGLLTYLLSLPDDWKIHETEIVRHSTDGIKSLRSALAELMKYGYIKRDVTRKANGQFNGYQYNVFEIPHEPDKDIPDEQDDDRVPKGNTADGDNIDDRVPKGESGENEADRSKIPNQESGESVSGESVLREKTSTNNDSRDIDSSDNRTEKQILSSDNVDNFFESLKEDMSEPSIKAWAKCCHYEYKRGTIFIIAPNNTTRELIKIKFLDLFMKHLDKLFTYNALSLITE